MQNNDNGKNRVTASPEMSGSVQWRSPSNIALVKYWGKKKGQIPENPSISITLSKSHTETLLSYSPAKGQAGILKGFSFEGKELPAFKERIDRYLRQIGSLYPFLKDFDLTLSSSNSFPHSSGIASSASALSAIALCITSMERALFSSPSDDYSFFRKASYAARIGSGSAARSVYPGYVLWGSAAEVPHSANEYAVPLNDNLHYDFKDMGDAILIVDESPKPVSSSKGHALMESNPWADVRYGQAKMHTGRLIEVLAAGDAEEFVRIVEKEAMTLHSLMMSSDPGYILLKPGPLEIIEKVRQFRIDTNIPLAFTLDAGPNVHIIHPARFRESVKDFVQEQLTGHCSSGKWIDDNAGEGPVEIIGYDS